MLVTACSPHDPADQAYYAEHPFEGATQNAVAAYLTQFPRGTLMSIEGYNGGMPVLVDSAGGSVIRKAAANGVVQIDVKFRTVGEAMEWGSQWVNVTVVTAEDYRDYVNNMAAWEARQRSVE